MAKNISVVWTIAAFSAMSAVNASGAAITVPVPCDPQGSNTNGLRSCSQVLNGGGYANGQTSSARGGSTVAGVLSLFSPSIQGGPTSGSRIQDQINCLYQGHDLDQNAATNPSLSCSSSPPIFPKPCNPVANPFADDSKSILNLKNHNGDSCGNFATIGVASLNVTRNFLGLATGGSVSISATIDATHSLEYSVLNGAFAQAVACFNAEAVNDIKANNSLTFQSSDACSDFAQDYSAQYNKYGAIYATQKSLVGAANMQDMMNGQNDWDSSSLPVGMDRGRLRQSAQQLVSARLAIESAFTQVVACEVMSRAHDAWIKYVGTPNTVASILNQITGQNSQVINSNNNSSVAGACSSTCQSKVLGSLSPLDSDSTIKSAIISCAQTCYNQNLLPKLTAILQGLWPTNPTSTNRCQQ